MMCETNYLVLLVVLAVSGDPLVTLPHGGKLQGVQVDVGNKIVDQFIGIQYAQPPVGELRFKKPIPVDPWEGVRNAVEMGNSCLQQTLDGKELMGSEDCLYLNIYLPGQVSDTFSKPKSVMVWIHGGCYTVDSAASFVGSALASHGDVIVIALNYRLGIFGFLPSGQGTGNYGLWDQRKAILWVKENIAAFGGDPESITIFGESAGAGSVVAQMMGQHNDGLFQRGIAESGALYVPWSWYTNYEELMEIPKQIQVNTGCSLDTDLYECLRDLSAEDVLRSAPLTMKSMLWKPVADDDFFPPIVKEENYDLTQKFDLMAGFNGQEGGLFLADLILPTVAARNESVDKGCSMEMTEELLHMVCSDLYTSEAPELCVDFIVSLYDLDKVADGRERAIKLSLFKGESNHDADITDMLEKHSRGDRNTYGYYFTKKSGLHPTSFWELPKWAMVSADHGEELWSVFGMFDVPDNIFDSIKGKGFANEATINVFSDLKKNHANAENRQFSRRMMTMWANFAKTGNPNLPGKWDEDNTPDWPQFTVSGQKFLELGDTVKVRETPNKERLQKLREVLRPSLRRKYLNTRQKLLQVIENNEGEAEIAKTSKDEL